MSFKHINELDTTYKEMDFEKEYSQKVHFKTNIAFLKEHNGYRPGNFHLFLGISGGGKSTLFRTLFYDAIANLEPHEKIGVWLSEDSRREFVAQIAFNDAKKGLVVGNRQIMFYSESDFEGGIKTRTMKKEALNEMIEATDILFYDNITTSGLYNDARPDEQSSFMTLVKAKCQAENTAMVILAHTGGQVDETSSKLLGQNDIRGNKTLNSLCQYYYMIQKIVVGREINSILKMEKYRSKTIEQFYFMLNFDRSTKLFLEQVPISFQLFADIFDKRNKFTNNRNKKKKDEDEKQDWRGV